MRNYKNLSDKIGEMNGFNEPLEELIEDAESNYAYYAEKLIDTVFGTNLSGKIQSFRDNLREKVTASIGEQAEIMGKLNADDFINYSDAYKSAYNLGFNFKNALKTSIGDYLGSWNYDYDYGGFDLANSISDIVTNTGDTADALSITSENLKYLRDLAERDTINRFTTAEINIVQHNTNNNVSEGSQITGMVDQIINGIEEATRKMSRGVHV